MSVFEHPVVASIIAAAFLGLAGLLWKKYFRHDIRILSVVEKGPTSREFGFTEPAVKITIYNKTSRDIVVVDIRLMFCGNFGESVVFPAPEGRSHRDLPATLRAGSEEHWYVPAEQLSDHFLRLYRPRNQAANQTGNLRLYARCLTGTGKVYQGSLLLFSTDARSHWP